MRVHVCVPDKYDRPFTTPHEVSWRIHFFNFGDIVNIRKS